MLVCVAGVGDGRAGRFKGNPCFLTCLDYWVDGVKVTKVKGTERGSSSVERILVGYSPWGRKESDTTE